MKYIIYKALNTVNDKAYVGLTTQSLHRRMYLHFWKSLHNPTCHFHRALAKYDKIYWTITILEEGETDNRTYVKQREIFFINETNSYNVGYNSTKGGEDFSSSEYQSQLQKDRVAKGTHPFLGGVIQSKSMKRRHQQGEFKNQNQKRISAGTHHFVGRTNPQKYLSKQGLHHNQNKKPWQNTKTMANPDAVSAWKMADKLYDWYVKHNKLTRGGSYTQMSIDFDIKISLQVMYYKYFKNGWNPQDDLEWVEFSSTSLQ